jgi:hypothetical protein
MVEFSEVTSSGGHWSIDNATSDDGSAVKEVDYVDNYYAQSHSARTLSCEGTDKVVQNVASSPVQLTVGSHTVLLLSVSRDYSSAKHVIEGWLKSNGAGVTGENVAISINGTSVDTAVTGNGGYFSYERDLQPECTRNSPTSGNATYTVTASFTGDTAVSATAWANMLDGTSYAACSTVQYSTTAASPPATAPCSP